MATNDPANPRFVIGGSPLSSPRVATSPRLVVRAAGDDEDDPDDEPTVGNPAPVVSAKASVSHQAKTDPGGRTFVMSFGRAAS